MRINYETEIPDKHILNILHLILLVYKMKTGGKVYFCPIPNIPETLTRMSLELRFTSFTYLSHSKVTKSKLKAHSQ